jgi:hypothetical protein
MKQLFSTIEKYLIERENLRYNDLIKMNQTAFDRIMEIKS